jgi:hypothetical protein
LINCMCARVLLTITNVADGTFTLSHQDGEYFWKKTFYK